MTVEHVHGDPLTDGELRGMPLFLRLWRRLGWTMPELDLALRAFGAQGRIPAGVGSPRWRPRNSCAWPPAPT